MLTKRQKEVLDFVESYSQKKGYSPSFEEIRKRLKLASVSTAHYYISKLKKQFRSHRLHFLTAYNNGPARLKSLIRTVPLHELKFIYANKVLKRCHLSIIVSKSRMVMTSRSFSPRGDPLVQLCTLALKGPSVQPLRTSTLVDDTKSLWQSVR